MNFSSNGNRNSNSLTWTWIPEILKTCTTVQSVYPGSPSTRWQRVKRIFSILVLTMDCAGRSFWPPRESCTCSAARRILPSHRSTGSPTRSRCLTMRHSAGYDASLQCRGGCLTLASFTSRMRFTSLEASPTGLLHPKTVPLPDDQPEDRWIFPQMSSRFG